MDPHRVVEIFKKLVEDVSPVDHRPGSGQKMHISPGLEKVDVLVVVGCGCKLQP